MTKEVHERVLKKYKKGSQTYRAYAYLVRGKRLNTAEAFQLGIGMRLPNKISLLRKDGVPIKDRMISEETRIKEYWIPLEELEIFGVTSK
jgi:hypothetical protein